MAGGGFNEAGQLERSPLQERPLRYLLRGSDRARIERALDLPGCGFQNCRTPRFSRFALDSCCDQCGLNSQTLKAGSIVRVFQVMSEGREAVLNVRELLPVLQARGVYLKVHRSEIGLFRLPASLGALILRLAAFNKPVKAILGNHANPEELQSYCHDVLADAQHLGVPAPRLEAAKRFLHDLFRKRTTSLSHPLLPTWKL